MSAAQTQMFEDEHPLVRSCAALNELRISEEIPDLTLELKDGSRLHAHRLILAARIPYLRPALRGPLGKDAPVLKWPTVPLSLANSVIQYVYTGQLEMTQTNVRGFVAFSRMVQLPILEEWGTNFLLNTFNRDNLANIWDMARCFNIQKLMDICLLQIKAQFESFMYSDMFVSLPADTVLSLLRSADLPVSSEEQLFAAVARWASTYEEVEDEKLKSHLPAMLKEIQWERTTASFRKRVVNSCPIFKNSTEGLWFMARIENWIGAADKNESSCPFKKHTRPPQSIFVFGGDRNQRRLSVLRFDSQLQNEERVADMEFCAGASYSVVDGSIFVIGGQTDAQECTTRVEEFMIRELRWRRRAPLASRRKMHAAAVMNVDAAAGQEGGQKTLICVFGGDSLEGDTWKNLASCEVYDVSKNRWHQLPDMEQKRFGPAAACLPGDSRVFVFGGATSDDFVLDSVAFCHLEADWQVKTQSAITADFWHAAARMRRARGHHAAAPFRGKILVVGGLHSFLGPLNVVEVFSPPDSCCPLGQWTELAGMNQPRYIFNLVASGDAVYALGNFHIDPETTVEAFTAPAGSVDLDNDFTSWTWSKKSPVQTLAMISGAASVCI